MEPIELLSRNVRLGGFAFPETIVSLIVLLWASHNWKTFTRNTLLYVASVVGIHWVVGAHTQLNYLLGVSECGPDYTTLFGIFNCTDIVLVN